MARVVFLGTPDYGVHVLSALIEHHEVLAVVTQPDRAAGRGRQRASVPPVKRYAMEHGLRVLQPERLSRDREAVALLRTLGAELFVLAAYGQILREEVLSIPPSGVVGVHASLLPRHRGAAPVAAAILAGDSETGVTLMDTDAGMDTGGIIAQRAIPISSDDTTETLTRRLAPVGAELMIETLSAWLNGEIEPQPQDDTKASYAPPLAPHQALIDWGRPAIEIERLVRAFNPWPGAATTWQSRPLKVLAAHVAGDRQSVPPGTIVEAGGRVAVATGDGLLVLDEVQPAGRRPMEAVAFARGQREFTGRVLGS
jgi:methionyl-tRNA formyltransferase